jgi:haloacetate dehalogenase
MESPLFDDRFGLQRRRVNGIELAVRSGGSGPPMLLLHGFPQTHAMWHGVAPALANHYTLVMPDLRGYGDSDKPPSDASHETYSKRASALDMVELMRSFGHERYFVCGHDRGGRVSHRMAIDHPAAVAKLMLIDISPTLTMYERTTRELATLYYHWFFLIQPAPLPEKLIGADPAWYLRRTMGTLGSQGTAYFDPRALAEYERCFTPAAIHAMCEDYRAAASIDLEHDRADGDRRIECALRVLWGERGVIHKLFAPVDDWRARARGPVTGTTLPTGHYLPEEAPQQLADDMRAFFGDSPT